MNTQIQQSTNSTRPLFNQNANIAKQAAAEFSPAKLKNYQPASAPVPAVTGLNDLKTAPASIRLEQALREVHQAEPSLTVTLPGKGYVVAKSNAAGKGDCGSSNPIEQMKVIFKQFSFNVLPLTGLGGAEAVMTSKAGILFCGRVVDMAS